MKTTLLVQEFSSSTKATNNGQEIPVVVDNPQSSPPVDDKAEKIRKHCQKYSSLPSRLTIISPFYIRPITSYGILLFCKKSKKWLMVHRSYSPEYLELIRGNYNYSILPILLANISVQEKNSLLHMCNIDYYHFQQIYLQVVASGFVDISYRKWLSCQHIIMQLLENSPVNQDTEWLWPKGRPHKYEQEKKTALREFIEETGINAQKIVNISKKPIIEAYKANNGRIYESKYWIYMTPLQLKPNSNVNGREINDCRWFTYEQAYKNCRYSKREALNKAASFVNNYLRGF